MLEARALDKSYGGLRAVAELSFAARPGEIFGLIGPNGAGKSTTIKILMGLLAPDAGELLFGGAPLAALGQGRIGYLPEERGLYKKAKVGELLRYLAVLKGLAPREARAAARGWLGRFGLADWEGRRVEELSKGMAQKVQFAGAVLHDPELLLFDEPFSGLDLLSRDQVEAFLLGFRKAGKTVLVSTHVMEHAERICDSILMIDRGKAVLSGSLAAVKAAHGSGRVRVECDGDAAFVEGLPFVRSAAVWPRGFEARLAEGADPDSLFRALAGRLRVRRFEVLEPSLHSIFVEVARGGVAPEGGAAAEEGAS